MALNENVVIQARTAILQQTSVSTANCAMGMLKTYLTWAVNAGILPTAWFRNIKRLKEPRTIRHRKGWWTSQEVDEAIRHAAQDEHQPTALLLVAVGCLLGLRPEEIIMLHWQDLDLDARDPKTGAAKPICLLTAHDGWKPKDGEAREIPIPARLHPLLLTHRRPEGYLLEAEVVRTVRKTDAPWAYRYDPRKVWQRIIARIVAAGGKPITMYGMRHTFASNLLIAGVSDVKIARWLGHTDTRMVHRHYGHLLSYDDDINAVRYGV